MALLHSFTVLCIFYLIFTPNRLKTSLRQKTICFLTIDITNHNGDSCKLSNVKTSSQRHIGAQFIRKQKQRRNDQSWSHGFPCSQLGAHSKYDQIQRHVQTSRESHDLNMGFRSQTAICIGFYARIKSFKICVALISVPDFSFLFYKTQETCANPEGEGRGSGPVLKITSYMGFYRDKHLDPPPSGKSWTPPGKCWTPLKPWKIIVLFEITTGHLL